MMRDGQNDDDRLYFAYGSNLHMAQMGERCPYAAPVGRARLEGYRLEFRGVLTIVEDPKGVVEGAVWKTTPFDERRLDQYEGFPSMYRKEDITVKLQDENGTPTDETVTCYVYLMNAGRKALPYPSYLAVCLEGAEHWAIPGQVFHDALEDDEEAAEAPPTRAPIKGKGSKAKARKNAHADGRVDEAGPRQPPAVG